jgi:pyruvate dehydrogenase E1 component alpha subunit
MPIYKRIGGLGIGVKAVDGNDVLKVYAAARAAVEQCRDGRGPFFLECATYRYREHVGPNFDFNNPYRTKKEVGDWMRRCPIKRLERSLTARKLITTAEIDDLKEGISREIEGAVLYAKNSPWPDIKDLTRHVY